MVFCGIFYCKNAVIGAISMTSAVRGNASVIVFENFDLGPVEIRVGSQAVNKEDGWTFSDIFIKNCFAVSLDHRHTLVSLPR
jgi:hypothetical protein